MEDRYEAIFNKYGSRIDLESHGLEGITRNKDRADRATTEQVLDARTRLLLFKMIANGIFQKMDGCVSTGKEANVYHASSTAPPFSNLAIKIYKTSTLVFKDRDRYVTGEHRFRHGYARHNPRKMVAMWAEKELRNLRRLQTAQIPSPSAILVKSNILVMEFLGSEDGWGSPRLKDYEMPAGKAQGFYVQLLKCLRRMYQVCRLVHADFSEYNIIIHDGIAYIFDVSQSVEQDHPHAFDFLKHDIQNLNAFFRKFEDVAVLSAREAFAYITDAELNLKSQDAIPADNEGSSSNVAYDWLEDAIETAYIQNAATRSETNGNNDDDVFKSIYIPQNLKEIADPEYDAQKGENSSAQKMLSLHKGLREKASPLHEDLEIVIMTDSESEAHDKSENDEFSDLESCSSFEEFLENEGFVDPTAFLKNDPMREKHKTKEKRKENKKVVKAANRERRMTKISKAEKKRAIKNSSRKKK